MVECRDCRLVRLDPRPSPEELASYCPDECWFADDETTAGRLEEAYRRLVISDHVSFVARAIEHSGQPGPVLDVGCGSGLLLAMLKAEGVRVLGLDYSPRAAGIAWKRNRVPAVAAALPRPPLAPGSCAVVTMFHVLEHLADPAEYIHAARELLIPNGRLVVQVPNAASWQFLLFGENWNGIDIPRHLVDFRAAELERLLDYCGFAVVRRKFFSLRDNPAGLATSVAPGLDPMARRVRRVQESPRVKLLKDLLYFALVAGSVPFAVVEAACRAGATVTLEARKKT